MIVLYFIWDRVQHEPVMTGMLFRLFIGIWMSFGLDWTAEQVASVLIFVETFITWITRRSVTPNIKLEE